MSLLIHKPDLSGVKNEADKAVMNEAFELRDRAVALYDEGKYKESLDKAIGSLKRLRDYSDYAEKEFRIATVVLLFDMSEINFARKDYKQSKKSLELIFRLLDPLVKEDPERFGKIHVLAMELSTRILRSRKKMLELLAKQQIHTGQLYDKVNSGMAAATDKLVESLRRVAEMLASTGDYNGALKFYMEAIRISKKRSGRVTRRDVAMTIEMARIMMHSKRQSERARRLLNAVLPHAVALETLELEQEILTLIRQLDEDSVHDSAWRSFLEKIQYVWKRGKSDKEEKDDYDNEK